MATVRLGAFLLAQLPLEIFCAHEDVGKEAQQRILQGRSHDLLMVKK
jgi:hypothetical protein